MMSLLAHRFTLPRPQLLHASTGSRTGRPDPVSLERKGYLSDGGMSEARGARTKNSHPRLPGSRHKLPQPCHPRALCNICGRYFCVATSSHKVRQELLIGSRSVSPDLVDASYNVRAAPCVARIRKQSFGYSKMQALHVRSHSPSITI